MVTGALVVVIYTNHHTSFLIIHTLIKDKLTIILFAIVNNSYEFLNVYTLIQWVCMYSSILGECCPSVGQ